jgi:hypothetical protein
LYPGFPESFLHFQSHTEENAVNSRFILISGDLELHSAFKSSALMKRSFFFWLFFIVSFSLRAQIVNVDKTDTADYTHHPRHSFVLSSGLEIDKQKTTLYDATNTLEAMWQQYKELFILAGSYRFTYNGPDDILNAGYIHLRYRHGYKNKIQPEPFVQYQWDNKRGLEHRFISGANVRYNFWRGDRFNFNAGLGLMYENEKWNYAGVDSSKLPASLQPVTTELGKINSYIRFDWKSGDNNDVTFHVFLQTRPDSFKPRIAPHVQWVVKAGKHIDFSIAFSGFYDTAPIVPLDKFYYSLSNSILLNL